jgi:hypothetical protein
LTHSSTLKVLGLIAAFHAFETYCDNPSKATEELPAKGPGELGVGLLMYVPAPLLPSEPEFAASAFGGG